MFGDKSSNVFWNMIKSQKDNKNKSEEKTNLESLLTSRKRGSSYLKRHSKQFSIEGLSLIHISEPTRPY